MTNGEIIIKGTFGSAAGIGAFILSPQLETSLRIAALICGIAASLVTIWKLVAKSRTENKP